jgi:sugar phosphate isomerase/epimerase
VDDDHLMYGQGTVCWDEIFTQLRANRFDGTFCVEFPVYADQLPFRRCVADLRRRWTVNTR